MFSKIWGNVLLAFEDFILKNDEVLKTFPASHFSYAAINVMPDGGGRGGPRDEVGTLNVLGHHRWGILANFGQMLAPGLGSLNSVKMTKANRVLNVGSLDTNVPPGFTAFLG